MKRREAVSQSLQSLVLGNVEEAVAVSSNYTGGAGTLYERETIAIIEFILDHQFTPDPALKPAVLTPLRIVAAAMELWGASDVAQYAEVSGDWTYKFKPNEVIQLLYTAGLEEHRLDRLRDAGVTEVTIRTRVETPAPSCKSITGKVFGIEDVPILPHHDPNCRCSYAAAPRQNSDRN